MLTSCYRCKRDKRSPKLFSAENDMDPPTKPQIKIPSTLKTPANLSYKHLQSTTTTLQHFPSTLAILQIHQYIIYLPVPLTVTRHTQPSLSLPFHTPPHPTHHQTRDVKSSDHFPISNSRMTPRLSHKYSCCRVVIATPLC